MDTYALRERIESIFDFGLDRVGDIVDEGAEEAVRGFGGVEDVLADLRGVQGDDGIVFLYVRS